MKTLLILRHAKSSWRDPGLDDHDRPLNDRGRRAASRMGRYLHDEALRPDVVLCSTARRTRETLERLLRSWSPEPANESRDGPSDRPEIRYDERLYLAGADQLLAVLARQEPSVATVLLIGHNPGLAELAVRLVGEGDPGLIDGLRGKLPTCGLVEIGFDRAGWRDLEAGGGRLLRFVRPRDLSG